MGNLGKVWGEGIRSVCGLVESCNEDGNFFSRGKMVLEYIAERKHHD